MSFLQRFLVGMIVMVAMNIITPLLFGIDLSWMSSFKHSMGVFAVIIIWVAFCQALTKRPYLWKQAIVLNILLGIAIFLLRFGEAQSQELIGDLAFWTFMFHGSVIVAIIVTTLETPLEKQKIKPKNT